MSNTVKKIGVLSALAAAAAVPFLPFLTEGLSFFTFHALSGLYPIKHQIARSLFSGEYPLWNPFMINGTPFHSGIGVFDPFLVTYAFLDGVRALLASAYLALLSAGLGMYYYLHKGMKLAILPSLAGALFYLANPFFAATCHETPFMNPPVFLPFLFYFYETGIRDKALWRILAAGAVLSFSFLAGNLESFYFVVLFFVILRGCRCLLHAVDEKSARPFRQELRFLFLAGSAAFCLMAFDLFPTLAMIFNSGRSANTTVIDNTAVAVLIAAAAFLWTGLLERAGKKSEAAARKLRWVLGIGFGLLFAVRADWRGMYAHADTNLFYPLLGRILIDSQEAFHLLLEQTGAGREALAAFLEPRYIFYIQPPIYLFTAASLMLHLGVTLRARSRWIRTLGWFALFFLVFPYTAAPNLFVHLLGLENVAYPRLMFVFFFMQAVVLAYGIQMLEARTPEERMPVLPKKLFFFLGALIGLSACASLFYALRPFSAPQFGDWLRAFNDGTGAAVFLKRSWLYCRLSGMAFSLLYKQGALLPVTALLQYVSAFALLVAWMKGGRRLACFFIAAFVLAALAQWNLYTFQTRDLRYVSESSPESNFLNGRQASERVATAHEPDLDLRTFYDREIPLLIHGNMPAFWNVKSIEGAALNLSPRLFGEFWALEEKNHYTPTTLEVIPSKIYDLMGMNYLFTRDAVSDLAYRHLKSGERYQIYENEKALPRFYFSRAVEARDAVSIKSKIKDARWSPGDLTLIEAEPAGDWIQKRKISHTQAFVRLTEERNNRLQFETGSASSEFLATTEAFHENWKAYVDGRQVPVVKTNFYFRGLFLEPGEHTVEFRYQDPYHRLGMAVTALFLVLFAFFFLTGRKAGKAR